MLNIYSKINNIIPENYYSLSGIKFFLSMDSDIATVVQSAGKYHVIKIDYSSGLFENIGTSKFLIIAIRTTLTFLRVLPVILSFISFMKSANPPLSLTSNPLRDVVVGVISMVSSVVIAVSFNDLVTHVASYFFAPEKPNDNVYFFNDPEAKKSLFVEYASDPNRLSDMKAMYLFDKQVLKEINSYAYMEVSTALMNACQHHNYKAVEWFYSIDPSLIHQKFAGRSQNRPFLRACLDQDYPIIKYLFQLDPSVLFDVDTFHFRGFCYLCASDKNLEMIAWLIEQDKEGRIDQLILERESFYTTLSCPLGYKLPPKINHKVQNYLIDLGYLIKTPGGLKARMNKSANPPPLKSSQISEDVNLKQWLKLLLGSNKMPTSQREIISAYKAQAKQNHPDKNPGGTKKFIEIKNAYDEIQETLYWKSLPES